MVSTSLLHSNVLIAVSLGIFLEARWSIIQIPVLTLAKLYFVPLESLPTKWG